MPLDFNSTDSQIELNQKRFDFEFERFQNLQSKVAYVYIIYTAISFGIVQILKYAFIVENSRYMYLLFLVLFIILIIISVYNAVILMMPKEVAYNNFPRHFYVDLKNSYEKDGMTDSVEINEYIKWTYNNELEQAIQFNSDLNNKKGERLFKSLRWGIYALIPYVICLGFYLNTDDGINKVEITNFRDIVLVDSIINVNKMNQNRGAQNMGSAKDSSINIAASNDTSKPNSGVVINPDKVIVSKPVLIKENKHQPEIKK